MEVFGLRGEDSGVTQEGLTVGPCGKGLVGGARSVLSSRRPPHLREADLDDVRDAISLETKNPNVSYWEALFIRTLWFISNQSALNLEVHGAERPRGPLGQPDSEASSSTALFPPLLSAHAALFQDPLSSTYMHPPFLTGKLLLILHNPGQMPPTCHGFCGLVFWLQAKPIALFSGSPKPSAPIVA